MELGASAVLLQCCVVGADLSVLLDSCTLMGVEGIVEVHTPKVRVLCWCVCLYGHVHVYTFVMVMCVYLCVCVCV
ncbi:hypothetical protein EON63_23405 [archaeon]|nr:MAG: hypothetical protein EON63_23405 [archaeon]